MSLDDNPFCKRCGFRTYPQWGVHACPPVGPPSEDDTRRMRHAAGDLISHLQFYRIPADMQIAAVAEALAFVLASNIHPARLNRKWEVLKKSIADIMQVQVFRQAKKTHAMNLVMDVDKPRLKAKRVRRKI